MTDAAIDVLSFWWDAGPAAWFAGGADFDARCAEALGALHEQAAAGDLDDWEATPHGTLALLILLDQIPRNIFRRTPRAFATDAKALKIAERAVEKRFPEAFPVDVRAFFYLPFEHAEDIAAQTRSVDLFRALKNRELDYYALVHMDAIRRFGRFPHRNEILGRTSTPEEIAYLQSGGFRA
ncbi:DUF924 family protein [Chthonobacter albigriseus]|uniref:DUF924 family protein n=1 Tax=Chthonobacter albigriseus TaxID=1683161 RepID=UPI0015EF1B62|nr:DUF924 family protein [Chthonobacter albigriseus]